VTTKLILTKMTGAGNDFLIFDGLHASPPALALRSELARQTCHRTAGVGADGLVVMEPSNTADFRWDFYNSDGSNAEMCGNAARCVAQFFASTHPQHRGEIHFETRAGRIRAQLVDQDWVEVRMPQPQLLQVGLVESILDLSIDFAFIDTGVPHVVIETKSSFLDQIPTARALRHHARFQPQGTNVTFYKWTSAEGIDAQTFERGVENFTEACGTGAVAAAIIAARQRPTLEWVSVHMPGGGLAVSPKTEPLLKGPAQFIAKVEWLR
jgi:diaminopimelate epimerase